MLFRRGAGFCPIRIERDCVHPSTAGPRRAFRHGCQTRSKPLRLEAGIAHVVPAFGGDTKCLGFEQCAADACVMRLIEKGAIAMLVVVHVDDIFYIGRKSRREKFDRDLIEYVPISNLGELHLYAGIRFPLDLALGTVTLSQQHFRKTRSQSLVSPATEGPSW